MKIKEAGKDKGRGRWWVCDCRIKCGKIASPDDHPVAGAGKPVTCPETGQTGAEVVEFALQRPKRGETKAAGDPASVDSQSQLKCFWMRQGEKLKKVQLRSRMLLPLRSRASARQRPRAIRSRTWKRLRIPKLAVLPIPRSPVAGDVVRWRQSATRAADPKCLTTLRLGKNQIRDLRSAPSLGFMRPTGNNYSYGYRDGYGNKYGNFNGGGKPSFRGGYGGYGGYGNKGGRPPYQRGHGVGTELEEDGIIHREDSMFLKSADIQNRTPLPLPLPLPQIPSQSTHKNFSKLRDLIVQVLFIFPSCGTGIIFARKKTTSDLRARKSSSKHRFVPVVSIDPFPHIPSK